MRRKTKTASKSPNGKQSWSLITGSLRPEVSTVLIPLWHMVIHLSMAKAENHVYGWNCLAREKEKLIRTLNILYIYYIELYASFREIHLIRKVFFFSALVDFKILQDPKNSLPSLPCASVVISCRRSFSRVDPSRNVVLHFFCTWCRDRPITGPDLYFCAICSSFKAQICSHTICTIDKVRCLFSST